MSHYWKPEALEDLSECCETEEAEEIEIASR